MIYKFVIVCITLKFQLSSKRGDTNMSNSNMNDVTDFYDKLDLKYPEIAIAMQDIDRINPGKVKFVIPVLTPNMSTSKATSQTVHQDSSNLQNAESKPEVTSLKMDNYVEIKVPKELCAFTGGCYEILESYDWPEVETAGCDSILHVRDADMYTKNARQVGTGSVSCDNPDCCGGSAINVLGYVQGIIKFNNGIPTGFLNLMPVDRYIKKGSKWIVVFVGGDVTKPRIIARYPDD